MARLDAKWVARESPHIAICAACGASPGPSSAVVASPPPNAAPGKSGSTAVKIALIVLAEFVRPSQYDGKSRSTFCIMISKASFELCGIRTLGAESSII